MNFDKNFGIFNEDQIGQDVVCQKLDNNEFLQKNDSGIA